MVLLACERERPPRPDDAPAAAPAAGEPATAATASFEPGQPAVLTYAGPGGVFTDTGDPTQVPEEARGLVRVVLLEGERAPGETVWVANLRTPNDDGSYTLSTVPRDLFEEYALGQGRKSAFELPPGLEPPRQVAATGGIVVYKTSWCAVCKKLEAYLKRKGVAYEAKDIEADRTAAAELKAKADAKGIKTGSVPVIDVRGELMVGFDRARLEKMLGEG